jgi:hypothetical protein
MANEPSIYKSIVCLQMGIDQKIKLRTESKRRGYDTLSEFVHSILEDAIKDVHLNKEDHAEIDKQIRINKKKREQKRIG